MGMGKIAKAIGFGATDDADDDGDSPPPSSEGEDTSDEKAKVLAMKAFSRADSPEAKAEAMTSFLEACGVC